jgi:polar amino acid transport system substrate-binding protein
MKRLSFLALVAILPAAVAFAADAPSTPAAADATAKPAAAPEKASPSKSASRAAPAPRPAPAGKLFEAIRKRGTLLVGTAWNIPWSMRDPQGQWQGFEIDVARQLAADLGVELTIVRVPFSEFTDALSDGRIDIVAAGYSITPQRALVADFSNPYTDSQMELVVRRELAAGDINRAEVKLGVVAGTTAEAAASNKLPNAKAVVFPTARELYAALRAGEVDGALAYAPRTTIAVAQSEGKLAVATGVNGLPHTVEAFAVRRGEQGLINYLNAWIAYWTADGWIAERHRYWFDSFDWAARFAPAKNDASAEASTSAPPPAPATPSK